MVPPQPHFVPGYTGWTPGCGPRRNFVLGQTSGHYTHELLHKHPVAGGRLNPLIEDLRFVNSFKAPAIQRPSENPHKPLDPFFVPGYTGTIPGSGNKRFESVGETYGRMSHVRLAKHRVAGNRLRPVNKETSDYVAKREEAKFYCDKHEITANDPKRRFGMVPGYTGHVPRALFRYGKTMAKISNDCIAEFEQMMDRNRCSVY